MFFDKQQQTQLSVQTQFKQSLSPTNNPIFPYKHQKTQQFTTNTNKPNIVYKHNLSRHSPTPTNPIFSIKHHQTSLSVDLSMHKCVLLANVGRLDKLDRALEKIPFILMRNSSAHFQICQSSYI